MFEQLKLKQLLKELRLMFDELPDLRKGKNTGTKWQTRAWEHFQYFSRNVRHF